MSINSLFYTSLILKLASLLALIVFFYAYWAGLDNRTLVLCLGISLASWIVGRGFAFYFEQTVARIAVAKHIAEQNIINQLDDEEQIEIKAKHPLFASKDEDEETE